MRCFKYRVLPLYSWEETQITYGSICRPRGFMRCRRGTIRRCRSLHDDRPRLKPAPAAARRRVIRPRRPRNYNRFIVSVTPIKTVKRLSLSHMFKPHWGKVIGTRKNHVDLFSRA